MCLVTVADSTEYPDLKHPRSQNSLKNNWIYLELGGPGLYSVNYQRLLLVKSSYHFSAGIGLSPVALIPGDSKLRIPLRIQLTYKMKGRNSLFWALCVTPYLEDYSGARWEGQDIAGFIDVGYRHHFDKNGLFAALSFSPLVYDNTRWQFQPWGAIKFGIQF
jgi:hypothetical protein